MKKKILAMTLACVMALALAACGQSGAATGSDPAASPAENASEAVSGGEEQNGEENAASGSGEEAGPAETEGEASAEPKPEDFEIREYLLEYEDAGTAYCLAVKSNAKAKAGITFYCMAVDANGNMLGEDRKTIPVIGPGEESFTYLYFWNVTGVSAVHYEMELREPTDYESVVSSLSMIQTQNDDNVVVTVTNNGDLNADRVTAYALFMDKDNNPVDVGAVGFGDRDGMIKPGKAISGQISTKEAFDHAEIYLSGWNEGIEPAQAADLPAEDFEVREMYYEVRSEYNEDYTMDFLIIRNNSPETASIFANATALDAEDHVISAAACEVGFLGPGEETITYFYFVTGKSVDHVEYDLDCRVNPDAVPVLGSLSVEKTIDSSMVTLNVTNNGTETLYGIQAFVLFLDADGKVVEYAQEDVSDDEMEIKPEETVEVVIFGVDEEGTIETAEVYLTAAEQN